MQQIQKVSKKKTNNNINIDCTLSRFSNVVQNFKRESQGTLIVQRTLYNPKNNGRESPERSRITGGSGNFSILNLPNLSAKGNVMSPRFHKQHQEEMNETMNALTLKKVNSNFSKEHREAQNYRGSGHSSRDKIIKHIVKKENSRVSIAMSAHSRGSTNSVDSKDRERISLLK
jgi:hypothetical protein